MIKEGAGLALCHAATRETRLDKVRYGEDYLRTW